jgi:FkbM family methyltransferase
MRRLASACDPTLGAAPIDAGARTGLAALLARAGLDAASRVVEQDGAASTRGRGILARRLQRMLRNQRLVRAQLEPLSDIIDRLGLERIDLLKIDVEGAECLVLDGWRREHWSRVAEIVVEVDAARGARQVEQQLAERGFTVVVPARDGAGRYVRAHRGG